MEEEIGTPKQAALYTVKAGPAILELGERLSEVEIIRQQARSSDLARTRVHGTEEKTTLKEAFTLCHSAADMAVRFPEIYARNNNGIKEVYAERLKC